MALYTALRTGDVGAVKAGLPANDRLADRLADHGRVRADTATRLATALGLPADASLADLADRLPEPRRTYLLTARTKLRDLTAQVDQFRASNANLIDRLRSYFQDILDGLAAPEPPVRYGPTGAWLSVPPVPATVASG
jgi:hypothetical protein